MTVFLRNRRGESADRARRNRARFCRWGHGCLLLAVGWRQLTAEFMGGLYSLSGSFPGQITHALIANEVLDLMNRSHGTHFSPVDVEPLLSEDPAVLMSRGRVRIYPLEELRQRFPQLRDPSPRRRTPSSRNTSP